MIRTRRLNLAIDGAFDTYDASIETTLAGGLFSETHLRILRAGKATVQAYDANASTRAETRPSIVCSPATTSTVSPAWRAVSAVTGPMHATTGGRAPATRASTRYCRGGSRDRRDAAATDGERRPPERLLF